MFDQLLESSLWDDSNKWSNIGFGEEIGIKEIKYLPYLEPYNNINEKATDQAAWNEQY